LEALVKVVDQYATLRKSARATIDDVWDAQRLLYEARLDSAETDEERVRAYEPLIAVLKAREAHAEEQVQAGRARGATRNHPLPDSGTRCAFAAHQHAGPKLRTYSNGRLTTATVVQKIQPGRLRSVIAMPARP